MVGQVSGDMDKEPQVREWVLPALSSTSAIGEKLVSILMANPNQVLRACRIGEEILFVAVEGEVWKKAD